MSPDGKRIAFVGTLRGKPIRSYSQPDLWVTDAAPGSTPKNLTADYDFDIAGGIGGDQSAPRGQNRKPIVWSPDGRRIARRLRRERQLEPEARHDRDRPIDPLTDGEAGHRRLQRDAGGQQDSPRLLSTQTQHRRHLHHRLSAPTRADPGQQHASDPRQLTHVNDDLFKDIQQSEPEEIWYKSFDGKNIQGWILKPPDFDPSKKYPLILEIHGGPHSAYGNTYTHEFQWMAAKGYVVLFTNPRGSTTYGQDFGNIIQYHYPGDDYKDLMAGVDEV